MEWALNSNLLLVIAFRFVASGGVAVQKLGVAAEVWGGLGCLQRAPACCIVWAFNTFAPRFRQGRSSILVS